MICQLRWGYWLSVEDSGWRLLFVIGVWMLALGMDMEDKMVEMKREQWEKGVTKMEGCLKAN